MQPNHMEYDIIFLFHSCAPALLDFYSFCLYEYKIVISNYVVNLSIVINNMIIRNENITNDKNNAIIFFENKRKIDIQYSFKQIYTLNTRVQVFIL